MATRLGDAFRRVRWIPRRPAWPWMTLVIAALAAGCRSIPVYEQRHVSKPAMRFSDAATWQTHGSTFSQLETGLAFSGGAQPTTCSACK